MSHKKNILILGAAGFLGSNMVKRALQEDNVSVTAVDSLDPDLYSTADNLKEVMESITFLQKDVTDPKVLREIIPNQDIIFCCAAQTSHLRSVQDPLYDAKVNCIGILMLLEAVRTLNPGATVVYPSTSTIVGKAASDVIDEDHRERPLDIYSANKAAADKYFQIYHSLHGLKTIILRFANLYGPGGKPYPIFGFMNYFISLAAADKPITVYGDGAQKRNTMYVDDATDIMWSAAHNPQLIGDPYYAVHEQHHSVADIAQLMVEVFGKGRVEFVPWPEVRKKIEIEHVRISSAALNRRTGWKARYSLKDGLKMTAAAIV